MSNGFMVLLLYGSQSGLKKLQTIQLKKQLPKIPKNAVVGAMPCACPIVDNSSIQFVVFAKRRSEPC